MKIYRIQIVSFHVISKSLPRSMMDIANAKLKPEEIEGLVSKMFTQASSNRRMSLKFEDFRDTLAGKLDYVWDVCLDFKGISTMHVFF